MHRVSLGIRDKDVFHDQMGASLQNRSWWPWTGVVLGSTARYKTGEAGRAESITKTRLQTDLNRPAITEVTRALLSSYCNKLHTRSQKAQDELPPPPHHCLCMILTRTVHRHRTHTPP